MFRDPRKTNEAHLRFIRTLPCCVCLNNIQTEAAHLRMSDARVFKVNAGVGAKPHDFWVLPLCNSHHALQHNIGDEMEFWEGEGIKDPIFLALTLYAYSGNGELAERVVAGARSVREFA